jgi:hypothetical protein
MHHHASRLIDHEDVGVLVDNREWNGLGEHRAGRRRGNDNRYALAGARSITRLFAAAFDGDAAIRNQRRGLIARHIELAGNQEIEAW